MSEFVRPTIPVETADAIEAARRAGVNNATIIDVRNEDFIVEGVDRRSLQIIPFDTLLAALVNGYERERAPEEYVRDLYRGLKEEAEFARTTLGTDYGMSADRARRVMECTLNALGIKIEGVNE